MASTWDETVQQSVGPGKDVAHGIVVAAIDKTGELFHHASYGVNSLGPNARPITSSDVFWIASCTKLLTSISALQLVEQGLVSLDDPVSSRLPELADIQVISWDGPPDETGSNYKLTPAKTPITLRHLLTHTAGFTYEHSESRFRAWRKDNPGNTQDKGLIRYDYLHPLLFEPGTSWNYGGSIDWAGELVSRISGLSLGDYFEKHIFQVVGMKETTFHPTKREDIMERLVATARRNADGGLQHMDGWYYPTEMRGEAGGAGLWSTVDDYIKVLGDLVSASPKLLKRDTILSKLAAPQLEHEGPIRKLMRARSITGGEDDELAEAWINHGLGGMLALKANDILPTGALGWGGLPNLKWFVHPERGIAAMYATQVLPHADPKNVALFGEYCREVLRLAEERGL